ncbi:MAG: alanine dehydrogenase [Archaeoglobales archaeon]|nr:alanine dehydrogenase [Archaeoglobales archaeon]
METLILTTSDIKSLISMKDAISAVEDVFKLHAIGKTQMPKKIYLQFEEGDLRAMPAFANGYAAVKWVNSHPNNYLKKLPSVMAVLILSDPSTGFPLAIMDATYLTSLRTGAAGGVAVKYLSRKDAKIVGFVGCGTQARFQLEGILNVINVEGAVGYDLSKESLEKFKKFCENFGVEFKAKEVKDVCDCDVLVTSTPSRRPIIKEEWIKSGLHINAIGADAPGKQELDEKILLKSKIFVDDYEQAIHSGEINVAISKGILNPKNIHASLGEVIAKIKAGREREDEITLFDSTGLAIQDVAVAKIVYERALRENIGKKVRLFE